MALSAPVRGMGLVIVGLLAAHQAAAQTVEAVPPPPAPWLVTLAVGTTMALGSEPHLPFLPGIGARVAIERGHFGVVGTVESVVAYCVNGVESDEGCGSLALWGLGLQATLFPQRSWSPYGTVLFQATHGERYAFGLPYHEVSEQVWVPALGPRLGVRYRAETVGFYLETGFSLMRSTSGRVCDFGCRRWFFLQTSAGVSFSFR